jgi:hypothetical protein
MAKFKAAYDSELMLQPLPEKTLTDAKDFRVVYDSNADPAVFGLRFTGQLVLIAKDDRGNNEIVDLGEEMKLPSDEKIAAFAVRQNPKDLKIYLAFGTQKSSDAGKIYVVSPFDPKGSSWYKQINQSSLLSSTEAEKHVPHKLLLVCN